MNESFDDNFENLKFTSYERKLEIDGKVNMFMAMHTEYPVVKVFFLKSCHTSSSYREKSSVFLDYCMSTIRSFAM